MAPASSRFTRASVTPRPSWLTHVLPLPPAGRASRGPEAYEEEKAPPGDEPPQLEADPNGRFDFVANSAQDDSILVQDRKAWFESSPYPQELSQVLPTTGRSYGNKEQAENETIARRRDFHACESAISVKAARRPAQLLRSLPRLRTTLQRKGPLRLIARTSGYEANCIDDAVELASIRFRAADGAGQLVAHTGLSGSEQAGSVEAVLAHAPNSISARRSSSSASTWCRARWTRSVLA